MGESHTVESKGRLHDQADMQKWSSSKKSLLGLSSLCLFKSLGKSTKVYAVLNLNDVTTVSQLSEEVNEMTFIYMSFRPFPFLNPTARYPFLVALKVKKIRQIIV